MTRTQPWSKKVESSTQAIVYAYHALRLTGILLQPVIPTKAGELLDRLGVDETDRNWQGAVWPVEVDVEKIRSGLGRVDKGKAPLFPPVL